MLNDLISYDDIVVGSGFAGAVAARCLAEQGGKKVLIIERHNHIGGNAYDCLDENGILIHKYGPHIFHTQKERVFSYLSRFTQWRDYHHEVLANLNGLFIPVPFNLNSLRLCFSENKAESLENKLINKYHMGTKVPITELKNSEDEDIRALADFVYNNVFLHYTEKQWGLTPEQIDPSVMARVPVLVDYKNGYFTDKWQGMPLNGYTVLFNNMLAHENIDVLLSTDGTDLISFKNGEIYVNGKAFNGNVIYTGAADELFDYCYGELPYRTLLFEFENHKMEQYQSVGTVNYTISEKFTRITEFKNLTGQKYGKNTTIMKEYSKQYEKDRNEIPYYPIAGSESAALYEKYAKRAAQIKGLYLLGRLAEYKYYNMDDITLKALELADNILENKKV